MAEKRYSKEDQRKIAKDRFHELRERGCIDAAKVSDIRSVHPEGKNAALKEMLKDTSFTKDQSQACREHGKDTAKERLKAVKENSERKKDIKKKGSYE